MFFLTTEICQSTFTPSPLVTRSGSWPGDRWWIQVAKMRFLWGRVVVFTLKDRMRSSDIWEVISRDFLLLCIKRSQLRYFGLLDNMQHLLRPLPWCVFGMSRWGRTLLEKPGICWGDSNSYLAWEHLSISSGAGGSDKGDDSLGFLTKTAVTATWTQISEVRRGCEGL